MIESPSESGLPLATLVDVLRSHAEHQPHKRALTFLGDGETASADLSYRELDRRACALAARLLRLDLRGERAVMHLLPGPELLTTLIGCLYAGVIAVPGYPPRSRARESAGRLRRVVEDSRPRVILTSSALLGGLVDLKTMDRAADEIAWLEGVEFLATDDGASEPAPEIPAPAPSADDVAVLLYRFESARTPRGVMLTYANLVADQQAIKLATGSSEATVVASWLPLYHHLGLMGAALPALFAGGSLILMPPGVFVKRPIYWLAAISRYRATLAGGPSYAYELCCREVESEQRANLDLSSWTTAWISGESVPAGTLEAFGRAFAPCGFRRRSFLPCFTLREATHLVSGGRSAERPLIESFEAAGLARRPTSPAAAGAGGLPVVACGRPAAGLAVEIVDPESSAPCPADRVGEIWIAGSSVAQGYWRRPDDDQRTFQASLPERHGARFLRTGSLGFLHRGELVVCGRIGDVITVGGRHHYPQDLEETAARSHPALEPGRGAAFAVNWQGRGRIVIVQRVDRSFAGDAREIAAAVRREVSEKHEVQVDGVVLVADNLPRTLTGRIRRQLCRQRLLDGQFQIVAWDATEAGFAGLGDETSAAEAEELLHRLAAAPPREHRRLVLSFVQNGVRRVLGSASSEAVNPHQPLQELGLDSLRALRLRDVLSGITDRQLRATVAIDYPTVESLAEHLLPQISEPSAALGTAEAASAGDEDEAPGPPASEREPPPGQSADGWPLAEPIAVIGIGCRFPGNVGDPGAFWELLRAGRDAVVEVPPTRWDVDALYDPDPNAEGKMYTRWGGFLTQPVDRFDARFFGLTPEEAVNMDPQHRLLLEVCWEALEHAGRSADELEGSAAGVFIGISNNDYAQMLGSDLTRWNAWVGTGNTFSAAAGRISYLLGLNGPCMAVDTACSSSLTATHLACRSLGQRECDLALAGGVNLILSPQATVYSCRIRALSPDGRCKAFDAAADGYVRSEGCGVVVLKRLSDAIEAGDSVLAVVRGSATNQDGRSSVLTAPSGPAQRRVIRQALENGGVSAGDVSYVEAHGTGTSLGDPIEAFALGEILGSSRPDGERLAIGSVKSNLGHLEAAAGIASLIKVVLALQHQEIPPSLHFREPSPHIPFDELRLSVQRALIPWPRGKGSGGNSAARAGVSSFGFAGTNVHAVLQQAPALPPSGPSRQWQLLPFSARTATALEAAGEHLADFLRQRPDASLADIAYTLKVGRRSFEHRRVAVCSSRDDAIAALEGQDAERILSFQDPGFHATTFFQKPRGRAVTFLLPGLGDHYPNMAAGLYRDEPTFSGLVDRCAELLRPRLDLDLRQVLYPSADDDGADRPDGGSLRRMLRRGEPEETPADSRLSETRLVQPALFVTEYALARLLIEWGIQPQAMIGYSLGEYVAACLSGVMSLEDALMLVAERARRIQELPPGRMLAVLLSGDETTPLLGEDLELAADIGPHMCIVAGPPPAAEELEIRLAERGVASRRLATSHAFHSRMMAPIADAFTELVATVHLNPPRIPYLSNLTGRWIREEEATDPAYWARHLCRPVRFARGVEELLSEPLGVFLEVGPGQNLGSFVRLHPGCDRERARWVLPSLRDAWIRTDDSAFLLTALGKLWLAGLQPDWAGFYRRQQRRRLSLPTYPFERQRYWLETENRAPAGAAPRMGKLPDIADWFEIPGWRPSMPAAGPISNGGTGSGWLVLLDRHGLGAELAERLRQGGEEVVTAVPSEGFAKLGEGEYALAPGADSDYQRLVSELDPLPENVLHLWSIDSEPHPPASSGTQDRGFYSLLFLLQALERRSPGRQLDLWVLTRGAYRVTGRERLCPNQATLQGLCRTIPQEHPAVACCSIDLDLPEPGSWHEEALSEQLAAELGAGVRETLLAYRAGQRWVQTYQPAPLAADDPGLDRLRGEGRYLITGGLGGIGMVLAEHLASRRAKLVLTGRSAFPERSRWQDWIEARGEEDPLSRKIRRLQRLEAAGAEVLPERADVADEEQMQRVVERATERFGGLDGVIHAAGVLSQEGFGALQQMDRRTCEMHFRSKVHGTRVLERVLKDQPLRFVALFSSISAVLAGPGLGPYAAANAFLDAFAHQRQRAHPATWISINWDTWRLTDGGPDLDVGGLEMTPEQGIEAFERILSTATTPQVVVSVGDLRTRLKRWIYLDRHSRAAGGDARRLPRPRLESAYAAPRNELERTITELWQEIFGLEQVGIHDDFFELGGQSLLAAQFFARLRRSTPLPPDLPLRSLFDASTPAALAELLEALRCASQEPPAEADLAVAGMVEGEL